MKKFQSYRYFFFCLFIVLPLQAWAHYAFQILSVTNNTQHLCQLMDKSSDYNNAFIMLTGELDHLAPGKVAVMQFYETRSLQDMLHSKKDKLNALITYQCGNDSVTLHFNVFKEKGAWGHYFPLIDFSSDSGIRVSTYADMVNGYTAVILYSDSGLLSDNTTPSSS